VVDAGDAHGFEFFDAGFGQCVGDVFVETGLHNADVHELAVEFLGLAFVGVEHGVLSYCLGM
jgi:hypothetical protein